LVLTASSMQIRRHLLCSLSRTQAPKWAMAGLGGASRHRAKASPVAIANIRARLPTWAFVRRDEWLKQHAWTRVTRADSVGNLLISIKMNNSRPSIFISGGETCWLRISPVRDHAGGLAAMPDVTHPPSRMLSAYFFTSKRNSIVMRLDVINQCN